MAFHAAMLLGVTTMTRLSVFAKNHRSGPSRCVLPVPGGPCAQKQSS